MTKNSRRLSLVLALLLLAVLIGLLARCSCRRVPPATASARKSPPAATAPSTAPPSTPAPRATPPAEVLTPATIKVPDHVIAGAPFTAEWTGPDNPNDYLTLFPADAPPDRYENFVQTRQGNPLELRAPIQPGACEVRYLAAQSQTVLGRAAITVDPAAATLAAAEQVVAGADLSVAWTGPNNPDDYITIVPADTPDGRYLNYTPTAKGSPLTLTSLIEPGLAELRYMTGQGAKVLARRPITIIAATVTLAAPPEVLAGADFSVQWTGPNNPNDYITIVPADAPDGRYLNYTPTARGSPLALTSLIEPGPAELRYMTGQGAKVLARRPITITAAAVTLEAPPEVIAGAAVSITWTGPNNPGDYITIVPAGAPDGRYVNYTPTAKGSPLAVTALIDPGPAELRYMSGQGANVLARRPITIAAAAIALEAPPEVIAGAAVPITWTGPNNPGDYITIVPVGMPDGRYNRYRPTGEGSPLAVEAPIDPGSDEIRYMSGQGARVLARRPIVTLAPKVTLHAPASAPAGSVVTVDWTGPANIGDVLTIVPKSARDGTCSAVASAPSAIASPVASRPARRPTTWLAPAPMLAKKSA